MIEIRPGPAPNTRGIRVRQLLFFVPCLIGENNLGEAERILNALVTGNRSDRISKDILGCGIWQYQEQNRSTYENRDHYRENPAGSDVSGLWKTAPFGAVCQSAQLVLIPYCWNGAAISTGAAHAGFAMNGATARWRA